MSRVEDVKAYLNTYEGCDLVGTDSYLGIPNKRVVEFAKISKDSYLAIVDKWGAIKALCTELDTVHGCWNRLREDSRPEPDPIAKELKKTMDDLLEVSEDMVYLYTNPRSMTAIDMTDKPPLAKWTIVQQKVSGKAESVEEDLLTSLKQLRRGALDEQVGYKRKLLANSIKKIDNILKEEIGKVPVVDSVRIPLTDICNFVMEVDTILKSVGDYTLIKRELVEHYTQLGLKVSIRYSTHTGVTDLYFSDLGKLLDRE